MPDGVIGQPLLRNEDDRLLNGRGRYSDDINLPGQAYAVMVRSPHACANIRSIDATAARAHPGVIDVLTGKDWLDDGLQPIPHSPIPSGHDGLGMTLEKWQKVYLGLNYPLAAERPRFAGEAVAMVIAESHAIAQDAAELVVVDYEPLPAVTGTVAATLPEAPKVWDEADGNVCLDTQFGDCENTDKAFEQAHHITRRTFRITRNTGVPMEPRAGVGDYDPASGKYTLYAGGGGAVRYKVELVKIFGVKDDQVRVVTQDVGGNFGTRNRLFPEYPLVMWAAKRIRRPVKNTTTRTECFLTDFQGRDLVTSLELALDGNGNFLAMRADNISNIGAYTLSFTPLSKGAELVTGPYNIPYACVRARGVFSHTVPTNPYRSAGRPEVIYALERLVDCAAAETGIERVELRRRNLVPADAMPFDSPLGMTYDSGEYHVTLDRALELTEESGYAARKAESEARGLLRGIGYATYVESSTGAPRERAEIDVIGDEKRVEVVIGTQSSGQGHETSFCQVAAEWLGVPFETVELLQGDTDFVKVGGGSHSGRSMRMAGTVIVMAGDILIDKGKRLAAHVMEAAPDDIDFADGTFTISGTDRSIGIFDLATEAATRDDLPEDLQGGLNSEAENIMHTPAFPYGAHICEVEIDPDTGEISLDRYGCVDDVGRVINPVILDGQIHGGIVQGAGEAMLEDFVFDPDSGQVLTASLMDYAMPHAADMPSFRTGVHEMLSPTNPLGIRSGGEAGTTPAPGAILNAVADALRPLGVDDVEMPATPFNIWQAIQQAQGRG
jgi:carbon-monoxide dehydrogenase large subunit